MRQTFTYTSDTTSLRNHVLAWSLILSFEGLVFTTLLVLLAPWLWLKLLVSVLAISGLALFVWSARKPLKTSHAVDEHELTLNFGSTQAAIPRSSIVGVEAITDRSAAAFTPTLTRVSDSRAQLTMSHVGQVLLRLDPPYVSTARRSQGAYSELLINVDDPERFLQAVNAHQITAPEAPEAEAEIIALSSPPSGVRMIEAIELSKRFGDPTVVDKVSFIVHAGEIYGFIGRNGAGKSTTINMLVGLLAPTSGSARINGTLQESDPIGYKSSLGYVADTPPLFSRLTGLEHLRYTARMHRLPNAEAKTRIDHLVNRLTLECHINDLVDTYSLGTKRKLALAIALLHRPRVLILDEPFNGLDPQTSRSLQQLIVEFANGGGAVLLSSHDLYLVARLCHRVGIMESGKLVSEGTPSTIQAEADSLEDRFLELTVQP